MILTTNQMYPGLLQFQLHHWNDRMYFDKKSSNKPSMSLKTNKIIVAKLSLWQPYSSYLEFVCIGGLIYRCLDGPLGGWKNGWMDGSIDWWMNLSIDGPMNGSMDGWMNGWSTGWVDGWMGGWMDGWMDGWTKGWMWSRWWMDELIYRFRYMQVHIQDEWIQSDRWMNIRTNEWIN